MLRSYEAIYDHGQLRWLNEQPDQEEKVRVIVTVIGKVEPAAPTEAGAGEPNGARLADLLERMAQAGVGQAFGDPAEWQRQQWEDRALSGRDDD